MQKLLEADEKITVEYKKCTNELSNSVFETVASFSNRYGGYMILGVEDSGKPLGVNQKAARNIRKNFISVLNDPKKMSPTLYLTLEEFEYDGKLLLYVYIPVTSTVERCAGRIYDRNEDGDIDITDSPQLLESMFLRKSSSYTEHKIFPYVTTEHLRLDLIPKVKQLASTRNPNHEWQILSDLALFKSAGLYEENFATGEKGFNMAAVLLFGKDEVIQSCVPGYVTDAILRVENTDRYDDRLMVSTNLIDSYDLLMNFLAKHTMDKFFLIDNVNTSVRGIIAREIISNLLVHREYSSAFPAKLIIEKERIRTENWNKSLRHGKIELADFTPYPKNPLLSKFFVNIGRADTLGSGVRNLYKYVKIYSGGEPEIMENDIFRITIPLSIDAVSEMKMRTELSDREEKIYNLIKDNKKITIDELAEQFKVNRRTILRDIQEMKKKIYLAFDKKEGTWKL